MLAGIAENSLLWLIDFHEYHAHATEINLMIISIPQAAFRLYKLSQPHSVAYQKLTIKRSLELKSVNCRDPFGRSRRLLET
jgi:hypothetical protein